MPEVNRILVVDDNAQDRAAVTDILRREGPRIDGTALDVQEADTIAAARDALTRQEFSCVFLDHDLPDGTSLDLLEEIRNQGLATPVVVLTGQRDDETVMQVMQAGAVDYLPKDRLHPDLVARSLRAALRFQQIQREKQAGMDELRRFQILVENANESLYLLDETGHFVYANATACRALGYTAEEITRLRPLDINLQRDEAAYQALFQRLSGERLPPIEVSHRRKDGSIYPVEASLSLVELGGRRLLFVSGRDISERKRLEDERTAAQQALEEAHARTGALLESITDAFFALDSAWRFTYINDRSEQIMGRRREDLIGQVFWDEFPATIGSELDRQYRRSAQGPIAVSFESFYPPLDIWVDVRTYPAEGGGLFVFYQDVTARKQAEMALQRSREDLQLAINAARLGTFYCDYPLDKIIWNGICKEHFFLPLDAEVDFSLFYSLLHPDDREATQQAIERAQAERREYNVEYRTVGPEGQTRWVNAVGRFYFGPDGEPTRFDGVTIDISERKAAEEQLRARAERESLLNRIGTAIRLAREPEQVLRTAVQEVGEALGADRCYFSRYDQEADIAVIDVDWQRSGQRSLAGQYRMSAFSINRDPVYQAGQAQVVADTEGDPAAQALGLRALVRIPLAAGRTMTALAVAMTGGPRAWTTEEVALAVAVATQTQTALEAVRVQRREHQIAQQLQDALQPALPGSVPGLSLGWFTRPALEEAEIGGDFFDLFPLDKDLHAVVLGDVSGKGLGAAQQLALIRNSLRTTLYLRHDPAQAAATLNKIVTSYDLLAGFVTVWIGLYNPATGKVVYCSCGHEPALVRRDGGGMDTLVTTGPPLGVAENAEYDQQEVTLSAGDALLLYTDGLSEAGPSRRQLLGTEGLREMFAALPTQLDAQAQARALVEAVSQFSGGIFRDDVAVLLLARM